MNDMDQLQELQDFQMSEEFVVYKMEDVRSDIYIKFVFYLEFYEEIVFYYFGCLVVGQRILDRYILELRNVGLSWN